MVGMREAIDLGDLGTATRELAELVAADGYDPDMILSIARGGWWSEPDSATRSR
jgi:uncharacterized protein